MRACIKLATPVFPFVTEAHDSLGRLAQLDRHCDAFLTNHVANRASRLQGKAFVSSARENFWFDAGGLALRSPRAVVRTHPATTRNKAPGSGSSFSFSALGEG